MSNYFNRPPYMELCLCYRCASVYYQDPSYYIRPNEAYQLIKETCDICQQYKGKDYKIWKKSKILQGQTCVEPNRKMEEVHQNE